jgi:hypothetical protein
MNRTIVSIEDHEDLIPNGYSLDDATTYFAIIFSWAYERKLVSKTVLHKQPYVALLDKLNNHSISIENFVYDCLDGRLTTDLFAQEVREFINDYIETGTLQRQLCKYFSVDTVYALPKVWGKLTNFFERIDKHYDLVKANY